MKSVRAALLAGQLIVIITSKYIYMYACIRIILRVHQSRIYYLQTRAGRLQPHLNWPVSPVYLLIAHLPGLTADIVSWTYSYIIHTWRSR